jgi:aryl-alcohol dehydrogenase-like predicted oxidoreductase
MQYRRLGRSGLHVSEICLGTWINFGDRLDEAAAFAVLDAAAEEGIDFFDTADVYAGGKAEEVLGRWMKTKDRRALTIATKCRWRMWAGPNGEGAGRRHIMDACHDSLRRLQTEAIDLYQIHGPDRETPAEETLRALDDLVRAGKIRYFGWSNYDAEMIAECARLSEALGLNHAISLQNNYSMLARGTERRDNPRCIQDGLGLIPYSPLAQGLLSEKYLDGKAPEGSRASGNEGLQKRLDEHLPTLRAPADFAHARELTLSQLALAWLLHQRPMTAPIIGASRPEQVKENARASGVKLSPEELQQMESILTGPKPQ